MIRTITGGLLGGFALYVSAFIFWGTPLSTLAYSRATPQASANLQAAMAKALTPTGTGVYIIPDPATSEGTVLYGKGPVAQLFYNSTGFSVIDTGSLIGGFTLSLAVGLLIAFMLRLIAGDFNTRARVVILVALISVLWMHIRQAVFDHAPLGFTIYITFSDFIGLALAGLIAAKLMNNEKAGVIEPGTLH